MMQIHVETAMDRQTAAAKANAWMKANLKPGQFFNMMLTPLLQMTVDVKSKKIGKPETLTKRLIYDYSVIINYFSQEELVAVMSPVSQDTGTAVNRSPLSYEQ